MAPSFDTVGWFSSRQNIMSLVGLALLEGMGEPSAITNFIISDDAVSRSSPQIQFAFNHFVKNTLGKKIERITLAPEGLDVWWETFRIIQAGEVKTTNLPWVKSHNASLGPGILERFKAAENISSLELASAQQKRKEIKDHIDKIILPGTVLVLPTAPCIAPLLDSSDSILDSFRSNTMALTCIAGLAGLPQLSIPALIVENCPVGISFIGSPGMDEKILDLVQKINYKL